MSDRMKWTVKRASSQDASKRSRFSSQSPPSKTYNCRARFCEKLARAERTVTASGIAYASSQALTTVTGGEPPVRAVIEFVDELRLRLTRRANRSLFGECKRKTE